MTPAPISADRFAIVQLVAQYANGEDPALILAIIEHESGFNPNAVNMSDPNGGSWGLMQVSLATAIDMGYPANADPRGLLDPATNIATGVRYLQWLRTYLSARGQTGDNVVIAAYNEGPGNALKGLPDYPYVNSVSALRIAWAQYLASAPIA